MNVGDGSARAATASRARLRAAATATVLVERGTHVAGLRCMWRGARAWGEGARGGGCACECEFWRQVLPALRSRCESDLSRTHISSKETRPSGKYETIISKIFLKGYCLSERCATYVVFRLVFLRGQARSDGLEQLSKTVQGTRFHLVLILPPALPLRRPAQGP